MLKHSSSALLQDRLRRDRPPRSPAERAAAVLARHMAAMDSAAAGSESAGRARGNTDTEYDDADNEDGAEDGPLTLESLSALPLDALTASPRGRGRGRGRGYASYSYARSSPRTDVISSASKQRPEWRSPSAGSGAGGVTSPRDAYQARLLQQQQQQQQRNRGGSPRRQRGETLPVSIYPFAPHL